MSSCDLLSADRFMHLDRKWYRSISKAARIERLTVGASFLQGEIHLNRAALDFANHKGTASRILDICQERFSASCNRPYVLSSERDYLLNLLAEQLDITLRPLFTSFRSGMLRRLPEQGARSYTGQMKIMSRAQLIAVERPRPETIQSGTVLNRRPRGVQGPRNVLVSVVGCEAPHQMPALNVARRVPNPMNPWYLAARDGNSTGQPISV